MLLLLAHRAHAGTQGGCSALLLLPRALGLRNARSHGSGAALLPCSFSTATASPTLNLLSPQNPSFIRKNANSAHLTSNKLGVIFPTTGKGKGRASSQPLSFWKLRSPSSGSAFPPKTGIQEALTAPHTAGGGHVSAEDSYFSPYEVPPSSRDPGKGSETSWLCPQVMLGLCSPVRAPCSRCLLGKL